MPQGVTLADAGTKSPQGLRKALVKYQAEYELLMRDVVRMLGARLEANRTPATQRAHRKVMEAIDGVYKTFAEWPR